MRTSKIFCDVCEKQILKGEKTNKISFNEPTIYTMYKEKDIHVFHDVCDICYKDMLLKFVDVR